MIIKFLAFAVSAGVLLSAQLAAQTALDDAATSGLAPETTLTPRAPSALFTSEKSPDSRQLIIYFVAILALAGAGVYFLKRGLPLRGSRGGENRLQLLETKILGNRQFLVVVKYDDNKMLLGVGPGQIQFLCPLDSADEEMEKLLQKSGPPPGMNLP